MTNTPSRKHPAHGIYLSPVAPTLIFLTVCCAKRKAWLASDRHHQILTELWSDSSHWVVGRYVLMPDHLHLFASPQDSAVNLEAWVKYWKSMFTRANCNPDCVWQTDHWDTRIRNEEHFVERAEYMFNNPVRAGLVDDASKWPYQGTLHELRWS